MNKNLNFDLWQQLDKNHIIKYSKPKGFSMRDIVETEFYICGINDDELMTEYLHFKLLKSWKII